MTQGPPLRIRSQGSFSLRGLSIVLRLLVPDGADILLARALHGSARARHAQ